MSRAAGCWDSPGAATVRPSEQQPSRGLDTPTNSSGSAAISDANLWVAVPSGSPDNLAASCHGSISNRARAERTLSTIPLTSSPMGANRKLSNSAPSCENLDVIAFTELHCLYRRHRPATRPGHCYACREAIKYRTTAWRVRLGKYLRSLYRHRHCESERRRPSCRRVIWASRSPQGKSRPRPQST